MSKVNWRAVLTVIGVIQLLAYRRALGEALRALRMGEMWREFWGIIWAMPQLARFAILAMLLGLLYVTAYALILNRIRR
jgi:ABC-type phosphate transport system permease subunit